MNTGRGTFDVHMNAPTTEVDGAVGRMEFDKTFTGDLVGTSRGIMLTAGDPSRGQAGYVAIEVVTGDLDGHPGTFAMQQSGTMSGGAHTLRYEIVPGSGTGELVGLTGRLDLEVVDGTHRYVLEFELP